MSDINIVSKGDIGIVELDAEDERVNVLGTKFMGRIKEVVTELKGSSFKIVLFTSKKKKSFIVGADIGEIKTFTTAEQFEKAVSGGQEIFNMIEDLPMPTMAVVNGICVGGGCEFIMACDYRLAADDSSVKIGLPEIKLGIIPGFGGCVRMPRII